MATSSLGPILSATIVTPDLESSIDAYCNFLHQRVHLSGHVNLRQARRLGVSSLAGAKTAWLANELDERWLRLIEIPNAEVVEPFHHKGWASLAINVTDVDALRPALNDSPFRIIGEPAALGASDDLRSLQVVGPAGESLYLTEVKAEVPPFDLPFARCLVDRVFIPVLQTDNCKQAMETYEKLSASESLNIDTNNAVIKQARNLDTDQRHPVTAIQLRGKNLIEIYQIDGLEKRPVSNAGLPAGIAFISFAADSLPESLQEAWKGSLLRGATGELFQLIKRAT